MNFFGHLCLTRVTFLDWKYFCWFLKARLYMSRSIPSTQRMTLALTMGVSPPSSRSTSPITWKREPTDPSRGSARDVSTHTDADVWGSQRVAWRFIQSCWSNLQIRKFKSKFISLRIRFIYSYAVNLEFSRMDIGERDRHAQMILVFDKRCGSKNRGLRRWIYNTIINIFLA